MKKKVRILLSASMFLIAVTTLNFNNISAQELENGGIKTWDQKTCPDQTLACKGLGNLCTIKKRC